MKKSSQSTSRPRATRAKKNQEVTVEEVLRNAHIDTSDPELIQAFRVESKKSSF